MYSQINIFPIGKVINDNDISIFVYLKSNIIEYLNSTNAIDDVEKIFKRDWIDNKNIVVVNDDGYSISKINKEFDDVSNKIREYLDSHRDIF